MLLAMCASDSLLDIGDRAILMVACAARSQASAWSN